MTEQHSVAPPTTERQPRPLVSLQEAARHLGVAQQTLRAWVRDGRLAYVRLGRRVLIRPETLDQFVKEHEVPKP